MIIKELNGIKVGDKVEFKEYEITYKGYVAVIDPGDGLYLLRLKGYSGENKDYYWYDDWYPKSEKKNEYNCVWSNKEYFTVLERNLPL